jgi:hypothetical protein
MKRTRLLLLSVGSLVGTAILECIENIGRDRFELIGANSDASSVNNFRCDVAYLSPAAAEQARWFDALDKIAIAHAPDLIIPGRDDDVVALARWKLTRPQFATMVGSVSMAEAIRDKWKSFLFAREHGLPFADSAIDVDGVERLRKTFGLPLIAKPRLGFGSNGVRLLTADEHVQCALEEADTVVQQAISPSPTFDPQALSRGIPLWNAPIQPGSPLAISLLTEQTGVEFVSITSSRHVRGAAIDNILLDRPDYLETLMRFSQAMWNRGWRGLFSIQARANERGELVPIELAGRFMGSTSALPALGVNVFERVLAAFIPDYPRPLQAPPDFDLRVTKQVRSLVHRMSDEAKLRTDGHWQREP